jgi:hypothetical protein
MSKQFRHRPYYFSPSLANRLLRWKFAAFRKSALRYRYLTASIPPNSKAQLNGHEHRATTLHWSLQHLPLFYSVSLPLAGALMYWDLDNILQLTAEALI